MPAAMAGIEIEPQSFKKLCLKSLKRTYDLFLDDLIDGERGPRDLKSRNVRIACKILDEYKAVKDMPPPPVPQKEAKAAEGDTQNEGVVRTLVPENANANASVHIDGASAAPAVAGAHPYPNAPGVHLEGGGAAAAATGEAESRTSGQAMQLDTEVGTGDQAPLTPSEGVDASKLVAAGIADYKTAGSLERYMPSAAVLKRLPSKWPKPVWHPPWKNYRVISGHLGWVRSIAFDPGNEWFVTGSADRTIKIWDLATAQLKLTLTGHIEQIRGLAVSSRHPYLFSAGDDKQVKCWDLEYNKRLLADRGMGCRRGYRCGDSRRGEHLRYSCRGGNGGSVITFWGLRCARKMRALWGRKWGKRDRIVGKWAKRDGDGTRTIHETGLEDSRVVMGMLRNGREA
ncbi:hypothetical protein CBR_g46444 [Chara braunii]|uniref:Uncharacterized protein n=1 Tax=Chara braunii TaxID=69332 RepID=A0A388M0R8_CHABU|nr:hypothetical protein CBR_g46444 [Chara braunii]|eukprot:GBG88073.1 hypothetical protein CBR_g46444 [Chara braunii]